MLARTINRAIKRGGKKYLAVASYPSNRANLVELSKQTSPTSNLESSSALLLNNVILNKNSKLLKQSMSSLHNLQSREFSSQGGGMPWMNQNQAPGEALAQYSLDLTQMAKDGKLDPVIGRHEEIRRTLQILARRTKNNPVLIGEPGTVVRENSLFS